MDRDFRTMSTLVEKGISGGYDASGVLHMLTCEGRSSWMAEELLQRRMWVAAGNYGALNTCVENGAVDVAKLLLDGGMDYECYRQMYPHSGSDETIQALDAHWEELQAQTQEQDAAPQIGGMTFG